MFLHPTGSQLFPLRISPYSSCHPTYPSEIGSLLPWYNAGPGKACIRGTPWFLPTVRYLEIFMAHTADTISLEEVPTFGVLLKKLLGSSRRPLFGNQIWYLACNHKYWWFPTSPPLQTDSTTAQWYFYNLGTFRHTLTSSWLSYTRK